MRRNIITALVFGVLICASQAFELKIPVQYDTLSNGLKVIIIPDTNVAVVSCRLYYFMGSMYEGPGTSGLSHMYEHMMFKGTKRMGTKDYKKEKAFMNTIDSIDAIIVDLKNKGTDEKDSSIVAYRKQIFGILDQQRKYMKKDEIWETYQNNGGTYLNAWTSDEITAYTVTLPQNKVELFCWVEADRMANPVLREFYSERDVVTEERRMRYENRPLNGYWEKLMAHFYLAHPYRIPTIGWMSDIRSYTRKKMRDHVNRYYTPDNALIVLVGNVNAKEALPLIKRYFEPIPRAAVPKEEIVTREPAPIGETRFTVYNDVQPRIDILFHIPGYPHEDLFALDIVEGILSGRSGRLYKRLVNEDKTCTDAGAGTVYHLHNGYFYAWANLKADADPMVVEKALLEELDKLAGTTPTQKELDRIKNSIQMFFIKKLKFLEGLSDQVAWFERLGSWEDLLEYPKNIEKVSLETVPTIVKKYCNPEFKTVGRLLQKQTEEKSNKKSKEANY